jgi:hypothetical protein
VVLVASTKIGKEENIIEKTNINKKNLIRVPFLSIYFPEI